MSSKEQYPVFCNQFGKNAIAYVRWIRIPGSPALPIWDGCNLGGELEHCDQCSAKLISSLFTAQPAPQSPLRNPLEDQ